jgi:hypothetical protein
MFTLLMPFEVTLGGMPIFGQAVTLSKLSAVSMTAGPEKLRIFRLNLKYDMGQPATMCIIFTAKNAKGQKIASSVWMFDKGTAALQFQIADEFYAFSEISYSFIPNQNSSYSFNSELKTLPLSSLSQALQKGKE